jgi:hypothetical protein
VLTHEIKRNSFISLAVSQWSRIINSSNKHVPAKTGYVEVVGVVIALTPGNALVVVLLDQS